MMDVLEVLRQLPHRAWEAEPWFTAPDCYPGYVRMGERLKPRTILEIGTFQGYGLIAFWLGAGPEVRKLHWVDDESYLARSNVHCRENLASAAKLLGWPLPDRLNSASAVRLPYRGRYDMIHVDGCHEFEGALADLVQAWSRRPRWLLVDDYDFLPEVRRAVETFSALFGASYEVVPSYRGWALFG